MDQAADYVTSTSLISFELEPAKLHALALLAIDPAIIRMYERVEPAVRRAEGSVKVTFYRRWNNLQINSQFAYCYNYGIAPEDIKKIRRFFWSCRKRRV